MSISAEMSYRSKLKAWAVEIIVKAKEVGYDVGSTMDDLLKHSDELVEYSYNPHKDMKDRAEALFEMVKHANDGEAQIDNIINVLELIRNERMSNGLDKPAEKSADDKIVSFGEGA